MLRAPFPTSSRGFPLDVEVYLVMPDLSRAKVEALVRLSRELPVSILVSYSTFKLKPATLDRLVYLSERSDVRVMLDSGAYHMARLGLRVDVEEYALFAQRYHRLFSIVVAPDVPGDARATVERTLEFKAVYEGEFLPVLQGSNLEDYLWSSQALEEEGVLDGYAGVGGLDGSRRLKSWLETLLGRLCGRLQLHLFGLGARLAKNLKQRFNNCIRSVDTGAWQAEITYRRRSELGVDGDMVELEYRAMKRYLERFNNTSSKTLQSPHEMILV